MYSTLPLLELILVYTPLVALPFGAHMWYNKAIPGTNTGNHSHRATMSLKTKVEVHPQSMSGDISLSSPSAPLLIRLTDQTAITRSRFISETTSQPPPATSPLHLLTPQHLPSSPSKACWVRCTILRRVCHVHSVDWSAQQNCFLEAGCLPPPPTHLQRPCKGAVTFAASGGGTVQAGRNPWRAFSLPACSH